MFQTSGKALQDILDMTDDMDVFACVANTIFFKFGQPLCYCYEICAFAVYLASYVKGISLTDAEIYAFALDAAIKNSPTFVPDRDCM